MSYAQICLQANRGCDGAGLARVLGLVLAISRSAFAVISDVDLVGKNRNALVVDATAVRVIPTQELLIELSSVDQVTWASIFLCSTKTQAETLTGSEDYVESLRKADGLVRVVDAAYYYVYGPAELIDLVYQSIGGIMDKRPLGRLDFPE